MSPLFGPSAPNPDIESIRDSTNALKSESAFYSKVVELARTLPGYDKLSDEFLVDQAEWSNDWMIANIFTQPRVAGLTINDPNTLLLSLEPETRKELLVLYLQDRFPHKAGTASDGDFTFISSASLADLETPAGQKAIQSFLELGKAMSNEVTDVSVTSFASDAELQTAAKAELVKKYVESGGGLTHSAFEDFEKAANRHPSILSGARLDAAALALVLSAEKTPFVTALKNGVFTDVQIEAMVQQYQHKKDEQRKAIELARLSQRDVKNKFEKYADRNFAEIISQNFSNRPGWQQLAIIGIGGYIAFKALFSKEKTGFQRYVLTPALAVTGFYLLGGRDLVRGTALDTLIEPVENTVHGTLKKVKDLRGHTEISAEHLEAYARYFSEVADKKLAEEVEAMGYISQVPISDIASSFTLPASRSSAGLDLSKSSALSRSIEKLFGASGNTRAINSKLLQHNAKLSEAMTHVFYMLGAMEKPSQYKMVEDARGDRSFDTLVPGSPEHQAYLELANDGIHLAQTKYTSSNWYQVIETLLESGVR